MKIITVLDNLIDFDFWGGARHFADRLSYEELEIITEILEETFPNGTNETTINDLFWFGPEWICIALSIAIEKQITVDEVYARPNRWEV